VLLEPFSQLGIADLRTLNLGAEEPSRSMSPFVLSQEVYSLPGEVYTNNAESFFSRMRGGEIGHHHQIAGPYLIRFAQEAA
jgi:hypothetical protein